MIEERRRGGSIRQRPPENPDKELIRAILYAQLGDSIRRLWVKK